MRISDWSSDVCSSDLRQPIIDWLKSKFAKNPVLADANIAALNAGHAYGETAEISGPLKQHHVAAAPSEEGLYRTVTGAESISLGLVAGTQLADRKSTRLNSSH